MNPSHLLTLAQNLALLLLLVPISNSLIRPRHASRSTPSNLLAGLLVGGIGVLLLMNPWRLAPNVALHTLSTLLGVSGLFFGPLATLLAMVPPAAYAIFQKEDGLRIGLVAIVLAGLLGLAWGRLRRGSAQNISLPEACTFGLVIHLPLLAVYVFPPSYARLALPLVAVPVLFGFPLVAALLIQYLAAQTADKQALLDLREQAAEWERDAEELRQSERRYRLCFDEMITGFALHEILRDERGTPTDYRFLAVNATFERITGLRADQIVGRTIREILPAIEPIWIERYSRVALSGQPEQFEDFVQALGKHFEVRAYCPEPGRFATLVLDVTEHRHATDEHNRLERQIQHTQKLESLGVLAGGIAHDFNNILMAILGHADLALLELPAMSPARENLLEIEKASRRAADLCRQMLAYSGRGKFIVETIDLRTMVEEMVHLLKTSISKKNILNLHLEKNLPPIRGDATQIRQVLMNLVLNASEAIGDRSGVITISTGAMECSRGYLTGTYLDENLSEGIYDWIEVSDTGCGMDKETQGRLFEPFFTTKFTGRGLGMAAALGIVRGHKGALKVYSELGKGTTFKILFPAVESDKPGEALANGEKDRIWTGKGTILLVDDEETIRALGAKMMTRLGFSVLTAEDGRVAVDLYRERQAEIVLVVLDLTMPHMNGEEAFRELRQLSPNVRVIMSSGYTEHDIVSRFSGKGLAGFIQKPYTFRALEQCLRIALGEDQPSAPPEIFSNGCGPGH